MKINRAVLLAGWGIVCFLGLCLPARAQVYSQNIVGYYNLILQSGDNLIANQLGDFSLTNIFWSNPYQPNIPQGTTFTKWDAGLVQFLPLSTYDTNSGWSINYNLGYGEGGRLTASTAFTNVIVGTVWPGFDAAHFSRPYFGQPVVSGDGVFLLSCLIPIGNANFYEVVGRDPLEGEFVNTLDALTQLENATVFHNGSWSNGDPLLAVGQSAFFGLGTQPSPVPEPSTFGLASGGLLVLMALRNRRRRI